MNEIGKTVLFLVVAGALGATAYFSQPRAARDAGNLFEDRQPFFKVEPDKVKGLKVTAYDADTHAVEDFEVKFDKGAWVIPTRNNYPADAQDRLKKTAGSILSLQKDSVVSDSKEMHKELGVVDPRDSSGDDKSWGKRITLSDENGNVLCDLIVGKDVAKGSSAGGSFKYVRDPKRDRVYAVECSNLDLSTRFSDWVKPELITDSEWNFQEMKASQYRQNPQTREITSEVLVDLKKDDKKQWKLEGLAEGQETDETKARDFANAISGLKIVGVRSKPPGLKPDLSTLAGQAEAAAVAMAMESRGFLLLRDGRVVSQDGDITVETDEGIVYTVKLGGVVLGKREEIEAGKSDEKAVAGHPAEPPKAEGDKSSPDTQENRFLLVSVAFNESKFPPIQPPPGVDVEPKKDDGKGAPAEGAKPAENPEKAPDAGQPPAAEAPKNPPAEPPKPPVAEPKPAEPKASPDGLQNAGFQEGEPKKPAETKEPAAEVKPPAEDAKREEKKTEPAPADAAPAVKTEPTKDAPKEGAAPAAPPTPADEEAKKKAEEEAKKRAEADAKRQAEEANAKYERDKSDRDRKIETGKKKAKDLQGRFDQWFYVVTEDQAKKLLVKREDFIKKPEPPKEGEKKPEGESTPEGAIKEGDNKAPDTKEPAKPEADAAKPAEAAPAAENPTEAKPAEPKKAEPPKPAEGTTGEKKADTEKPGPPTATKP